MRFRQQGDSGVEKFWNAVTGQEWVEVDIPDSYNPRGLCPHCLRQSNFEIRGEVDISFHPKMGRIIERDGSRRAIASERVLGLTCRGCGLGIAVVESCCYQNYRPGSGSVVFRGTFAWPLASAIISEDIPQHIGVTFGEAIVALSAKIPRAAALMARTTLEAITIDQGESDKDSLAKRLKNLAVRQILQPQLAEWAEEIRLLGNKGAHTPSADISLEDVSQLIGFIKELMRYLYEMPAELQRRRIESR